MNPDRPAPSTSRARVAPWSKRRGSRSPRPTGTWPVVGLAPGRAHCRRLRAGGRAGAPIVHRLLGRGESLLEVDPMDLAGVFAEPVVEWDLGRGEPDERGLQVVCLQVDDGEVSPGGRLDPD